VQSMAERPVVIIDQREPIERMAELFDEQGYDHRVEIMEAGDYRIGDMVFSLKSYNDLEQSVHTQHMHNEIEGMLKLPPEIGIMLIVWERETKDQKWVYKYTKGLQIRARQLAHTMNALYLPVRLVKYRKDAVAAMIETAKKADDRGGFPIQYRRRVEVISKTISPIERMYMQLPSVGRDTARRLAEKYPTIDTLVDAIQRTHEYDPDTFGSKQTWLETVWFADTGIGEVSGEKIKNILCDIVDDNPFYDLPIPKTKAKRLYKKYPTMEHLADAIEDTHIYDKQRFGSKKHWLTVVWYSNTGIGATLAERIVEHIERDGKDDG